MSQRIIYVQGLIPEELMVCVSNEEQLRYLGKSNILFLIRYWRKMERFDKDSRRFLQGRIDLLKECGPQIKAAASRFNSSPLSDYPSLKVEWTRSTQKDSGQLFGMTTFEACRFCRYCSKTATGESSRVACQLIPGHEQIDLCLDSLCLITTGKVSVSKCINHARNKQKDIARRKADTVSNISYLRNIYEDAELKPAFPSCRDHLECFKPESRVVFVPLDQSGKNCEYGTVIEKDQTTPWSLIDVIMDCSGKRSRFHYSDPQLLSQEDYEYLVENPHFTRMWLNTLDRDLYDLADCGRSLGVSMAF